MSPKERYIKYCANHKELPLFLQNWWLDTVCTAWDVAISMNGENIAGVWPYSVEHKLNVSLLRTPLLSPYAGPYVFFPTDIKESNRDSFEHDTIQDLLKQMPAAKMWHLALSPGLKQVGVFNQHGFEIETKQTFIINLKPAEALLLGNLKESLRRNIKSAEKELTIEEDRELIPELYKFHKATLLEKRIHSPFKQSQLQQLYKAVKAKNAGTLYSATKGNVLEAVIFVVWDNSHAYYFMGAQNPNTNNFKAMSALLWHAIKQAKPRGNAFFDLEGSMDAGVERFFRGFGGMRELYLVIKKNESLVWKLKERITKMI